MKSFEEYYATGYEDEKGNSQPSYSELVKVLLENYPVEKIANMTDEEKEKRFIRLFGAVLKLKNLLSAFDDFTPDKQIIPEMHYQDYLGWYNTLYEKHRKPKTHHERENITDDLIFEMELVKQVQINIHYILELVQQYHDTNCQDKEIIVKLRKQIDASPDLRDKRDLIEKFINKMTPEGEGNVGNQWEAYIEKEKAEQLEAIINEENLKPIETAAFVQRAFQDGYVTETGTGIAKILPPSNPVLPESGEKKQTVINKLKDYLNKFMGTVTPVNINLTVHNHYHGTVETVVNIGETEE
jgi:type I restriction enzyme R subunit